MDFFAISFFYGAPCLHLWYCKALPKIQAAFFPKAAKPAKVIGLMLLDELAFSPFLYSAFYLIHAMIKDRDVNSIGRGVTTWKQKIWETLVNSWKLWPVASLINFWYVPVKFQVLFVNVIGLLWSAIMSFIVSQ